MKSIKTYMMAAAMIAVPFVFTSCEDLFGEWSKPTPVVVTPPDPTPENVVKATDLLKEAQKEGATVVFCYYYEGDLFYAAFKKVGDEYVYQEGGNCNKASTRCENKAEELSEELIQYKIEKGIKDLVFSVYSADDAGNKIDPILLDKISTSTAEVEQKTNCPNNYMVAIGAIFQNASIKKTVDEVKEVFNGDKNYQPNIKDTEHVLILTLDENNDKPQLKPLEELMKIAAELKISPEKFIGATIDNLKQKVAEDYKNGVSVIEQGETLTTTISLEGFNITRGLDAQGKKTFAKGDQVAIYYTNASDIAKLAITKALETSDITSDGNTAKFTATLENPKAGGKLRFVYPASMAETEFYEVGSDYENVSNNFIEAQDGTLETIGSKYGLAIYDGTLTSDAKLPATATLENRLTIGAFTIKDNANTDITDKITQLTVTMCGNDYKLTRPATDEPAAGPIYVVMFPTPGTNQKPITITATTSDGTTTYKKEFQFNFAANNIYPMTVNVDAN